MILTHTIERRKRDITLFFEKEIRDRVKNRIPPPRVGMLPANILEYQYNERFYVNEEGDIVYFMDNDKEVHYPSYNIQCVVMHDLVFKALLADFEKECTGMFLYKACIIGLSFI